MNTMTTVEITLKAMEWREVRKKLADTFFGLYGFYDYICDNVPPNINSEEFVTLHLTGNNLAFDDLRDIFDKLGFVINF